VTDLYTNQGTNGGEGERPRLGSPQEDRRRFEGPVTFVLALGTLLLSTNVISPKILLIYLYGWDRFSREHLRFLDMPKTGPWRVSNGDLIPDHGFILYLIGVVCWLAIFFTTYLLLRRLLPKRKTGRTER
jgi:hypothetical protein